MALSTLLPSIQQLLFLDKLRLIGILAEEIQQPFQASTASAYLQPDQIHYIYTPYDTFGAAEILMKTLEDSNTTPSQYEI
ncbi:MAG: hypothetical protein AAF806_18100 [Bacteroidota bacterium]